MFSLSHRAFRLAGRIPEISTMRRRTAVAGPIPGGTMPRPRRSETSQGHLRADTRHGAAPRAARLGRGGGRAPQPLGRRGGGEAQGSVVRYRRAMVVLASAGGNTVEVIARL